MSRTGYVLAGGASSRMGRDKALLLFDGAPLAGRAASAVREAAGSAVVVGDPARHGGLGFQVIPDRLPGCGPLGGIHAALCHTACEWNLIVACDMPFLQPELLRRLLDAAFDCEADVLLAAGPGGLPEPLCGVWRRSAREGVEAALASGVRKVADAAREFNLILCPISQMSHLTNVNTPEDWAGHAPH